LAQKNPDFDTVEEKLLEVKDAPRLVWVRVQDALGLIVKENPKKHNIGELISSLTRYGYQEVAKLDATIGGIKAGNGRIEALAFMERDNMTVPRGIAVEKDTGAWVVPVTVGVDAVSRSEGLAYLVDSNNLVLSGGDLDGFDMARMWDAHYVDLLGGLDELPVTVDAETLEALLAACKDSGIPDEPQEHDGSTENDTEWIECPKCGHKWLK
jgi:hypothetical protein